MNYLIIGGSAAGLNAAESIRSVNQTNKITLLSDEDYPLYSRCLITYYLAGTISEEKLKYRKEDFFSKNGIEAMLGVRVGKVHGREKKVKLSDGRTLPFDRLLLATGARPKLMNIPGADKKGVFGIRTIQDISGIKEMLNQVKTVAILGGGLIGLRDAYALKACHKEVRVIVKSNRVLSQMLDEDAAGLIQRRLEEKGIEIMTGLAAREIIGGDNVQGILLDNGERLDCELVIIGKGVSPNISLVDPSEINIDKGILVNDFLESSASGIYAAGDCAQVKDFITGESTINALWPCAVEQGKIAGLNMTGKQEKYEGSMAMNSVEFFGLPTISLGVTRPKGEGYEILSRKVESRSLYKKIVLQNNRIAGVILVNSVDKAGVFYSLMRKRVDVSGIKDVLLEDYFNFAKILPLIRDNQDRFEEEEYLEYRTF